METPARRQTRQRRLVYEAVAATDTHPTAEWVYDQVRRALPRVSLGTVYRNLQLLVADGKLEAWSRGRVTRYDADVDPHDHFVCRGCGLLLDIERAPEAISSEKRLRARPSHREPDSGIHWRLPEVPTAPLTSTGGKRIWRP